MKTLVWLVIVSALMYGCATTKSGLEKSYDVTISVDNGSNAEFYMGVEADTRAETMSGDAGATSSVDPAVALGMQGSTTSASDWRTQNWHKTFGC